MSITAEFVEKYYNREHCVTGIIDMMTALDKSAADLRERDESCRDTPGLQDLIAEIQMHQANLSDAALKKLFLDCADILENAVNSVDADSDSPADM